MRHEELERSGVEPSFVKRLGPRERTEPDAVARRKSEAALLARLSRSGVTPRLMASGEDELGPWHRTERILIPTLAERIERSGRLDEAWIERAVFAAYEALAIVHEASDEGGPLEIVHGDLSPANLAIDDDGTRALLLDFDLAVWRERAPPPDGAFRGTIGYVAPELARGEPPTPRSDLFGLAAALFHAATGLPPRPIDGSVPFPALLMMAAEVPIAERELDDLAAKGEGHAILAACLAHDPARRPASARACGR